MKSITNRWRTVAAGLLLLLGALGLASCGKGDNFQFTQDTPDEVLDAARRMVLEGHAELLPELVYAEDERIRKLYRGLGGLLGALEELTEQLMVSYPVEVQMVRAEAEKAVKEGKSSSMISAALTGRQRSRNQESRFSKSDDPINDALQSLLADPYGWLKTNADKLTLTPIDDSTVAVLWEDRPIMPPFGLIIQRKDDDKWYIVLPTSLPMVKNLLPSSDDELELWLGILGALEHSLDDLRKAVKRGEIKNLDDAAGKLVEYVMPTAMIAFYAYGKWKSIQEEEKRAERSAADAERAQRRAEAAKRRDANKPAPAPARPPPAEGASPPATGDAPSNTTPEPSTPAQADPQTQAPNEVPSDPPAADPATPVAPPPE